MTRQISAVLGFAVLIGIAVPAWAEGPPAFGQADRAEPAGPDRRAIVFESDLGGMKAALKLRPDQGALWNGFETAARAGFSAFSEPKLVPDAGSNPDNSLGSRAERMLRMGEALRTRGEALKRVDAQWKALLGGLDDEQRTTANVLGERMLRELGGGRHAVMGPSPMPWRGGERMHGPAQGPGQRM